MKEPPRQSKFHFPKITFGTIIDGYLVKKFIPPFFLTFFLCLLIILMQFLWKYVDDLVGKGLEWYLILELLFYASATYPDNIIESIAVTASQNGILCDSPASPCGACRQVMAQYQTKGGRPMTIILVGGKNIWKFDKVDDLLPLIFDSI